MEKDLQELLTIVKAVKDEDVKEQLNTKVLELAQKIANGEKQKENQKVVIGKALRNIQKNLNSKGLVDKQGLAETKNKLKILLKA